MRQINSFAEAVHRLRRERGMSLGDVAAKARYSPSYLSKLLHGHRRLLPEVVRQIDRVLDAKGQLERLAEQQRSEGSVGGGKPMQLPADVPGFVGRADVLRMMDAALVSPAEGGAHAIVIEGGFWVGKTALAVHWVTRNLDRFPGGCLFADMRGLGPGAPRTPEDVLDGFLQALGAGQADLNGALEVRAARFRSILAERPAMVVLDNITDYSQVRHLLPGGGSVVVVTSREHQTSLLLRTGGVSIDLPALPAADALTLLARRVGRHRLATDPVAAEAVVRRCGRLPMAVLIVAEHLQQRPDSTMGKIAAKLATDHHRLDLFTSPDPSVNIHGVIDLSYLALPPAAARLFRLLGISPAYTVSADSAAVLADIESDLAESLLAVLRQVHLVTAMPDGRYCIDYLLRAYAYQRALVEEDLREVEKAQDRVLRWYTARALSANNSLIPNWRDSTINSLLADFGQGSLGFDEAMSWCQTEVATALQIAKNTRSHLAKDLLWVLPTAFLPFFAITRSWTDWLIAANDGLDAATAAESTPGTARSLQVLGWAERDLGRTAEAISHLTQALKLYAELGDELPAAWTAYGLALALTDSQRHGEAIAHFLAADDRFQALHHDIGVVMNRAALALAFHEVGDRERAVDTAREALSLAQRHDSDGIHSAAHHSLGLLLQRRGEHRAALTHFDAAASLRRRSWQQWNLADTLIARADSLLALGVRPQATATYERAADILESLRDSRAHEIRARAALGGKPDWAAKNEPAGTVLRFPSWAR
ncbi:helix-turn-helix domain-containing protein [Amycolatopsis alba]|uniref:Transcriptional regulator n=1 Tax=Amycolatopsis alba DSM 44262 TaxID=1125972 RepID=A0A229RBS5_AMYAL|nr:helix-turn-helix domain-containing protein [Amycolatopsis alba]OXM44110.1 transcriptional regulator [Amycolatopsis alba DSM 44262]